MVYRLYVERKPGFEQEAASLLHELKEVLGIQSLERVRLFQRYDIENAEKELLDTCRFGVFAEPQTDRVTEELPNDCAAVVAVEYLPGQYDQRADAAEQCMRLISQEEGFVVRTARAFAFYGKLSGEEVQRIKKHLINPVESREASLAPYATLKTEWEAPEPVATVEGFIRMDDGLLAAMLQEYGFAMDLDDLRFCRDYFASEHRDPTVTELKVLDTYWSDHCRHTTFSTVLDNVTFEDALIQKTYERYLKIRQELGSKKPVTLMDMATIAGKYLKRQGKLNKLDDSKEINACTVKITAEVNGEKQPWLLLFKNETHNHPTEIEPFGGAATCIGGAIRDPLSGRGYVYQAMRVTGAADPRRPVSETIPGKLSQRKIVTTAARGYSSYGNQIGLPTGIVEEIYDDGYAAKRMEIGAVVAAAKQENVRREEPIPGDLVILLGGRTGRDGCGGATGSSKAHTAQSLDQCGAEVQKGNAPEERKLQRLFRNPEATKMIKRCNDFGAGGVSVAIGELADGLRIQLDAVPKKYAGLDGTELAISESQERMAVVVTREDASRFAALADGENLEATVVAQVTDDARLIMEFMGQTVADISRAFIDTNGAPKHAQAAVKKPEPFEKPVPGGFSETYKSLVTDLNVCAKRGLVEMFDSTVGANTVLMPLGGKRQRTPVQVMAAKIPAEHGDTVTCSLMSWGYNPKIAKKSPYHGAYLAVVEALCKLVAAGAPLTDCYMSFQEYFEKLRKEPARWGKPAAALLGGIAAQLDFGVAAIGGKDSMSGSFEALDVPPTLVAFAVAVGDVHHVISPEFKRAGSKVVLLRPEYENGLPKPESLVALLHTVQTLIREKKALSAWAPAYGGVAEAVYKMALGNSLGFAFVSNLSLADLFSYSYGSFVLELADEAEIGMELGRVTTARMIARDGEQLSIDELEAASEGVLEDIFPTRTSRQQGEAPLLTYRAKEHKKAAISIAKPQVLIPVFPGTNCEYESRKAVELAGGRGEILVINTKSPAAIGESISRFAALLGESQMLFIPGGFSNGDEPDGSGKFITAFLRNPAVAEQVENLLYGRDGLICGICNGFQALIKLGLVPYGHIQEAKEDSPTLTYNAIGRHQSKLTRVRLSSNNSPWLRYANVGEIYTAPVSHGEGRFLCPEGLLKQLADNGQIITQYVDEVGTPTMDIDHNPNGSVWAVEGIVSPDGRVLGKMAHSERVGEALYQNVAGNFDLPLFRSAVDYYK